MDKLADTLNDALKLVTGKLSGWLEGLITMLPNLLVAGLVLLAFYWLARGVQVLLRRGLGRIATNQQVVRLISTIARVGVMIAGLFVALGILNLDKTVTSLLAGVGIVGLALGFAFQDLAQNFISGIIMSVRHQFQLGDLVEVNDTFGTVEAVDLRSTRIRKPSGEVVTIPNRKILDNPIINFTTSGARRVAIEVGVGYDDDVPQALGVLKQALEGVEGRDQNREVQVFATGFGASSIDLVGRFWIPETAQARYLAAQSGGITAIKAAFDQAEINIPFPIRTLDFGAIDALPPAQVKVSNGNGEALTQH